MTSALNGRYHREFCEYVQKDSGEISRKDATAVDYEPYKGVFKSVTGDGFGTLKNKKYIIAW